MGELRIPFGSKSTADDVLAGVDLAGRTIVVTGCNSGIGFETMRSLAAHGAHVLGVARTIESAKEAVNRCGANATPIACDLADFSSIVTATDAIKIFAAERGGLDALVVNAGIMGGKERRELHGVELQFAVNHLANFAFVEKLASFVIDGGRIVIVSSSASIDQAPRAGILFDDLGAHHGYRPFAFYGQSKLAQAMFARALSRRLAPRRVAVNAVHPGAVRGTKLQRELRFPLAWLFRVASVFMKSVEQGAATQVLLAASPLVASITGKYWADCQIARGSRFLEDDAMIEKLERLSQEWLATRERELQAV